MDEERPVLFWFVQDGVMKNGHVIASLDFALVLEDSPWNEDEIFMYFLGMKPDNETQRYVKRPGKWYLLSGMSIVHGDDLYGSREDAAKAEYTRLVSEN